MICGALALAVCLGSDRTAFNATATGIVTPPAWVWTNPLYTPKIKVEYLDNARLNSVCKTTGVMGGCSYPSKGATCVIYINAGYTKGPRRDAVERHEEGHCRGWASNHSPIRGK